MLVMFLFGGNREEAPIMPQAAPQQQTPPSGVQTQAARYVPGTYFSEIRLANSTIIVSVEVSENAILSVSISDPYEAQEMFYPLMQPTMYNLSHQIVETQSLNVQHASDTPYTQEVLISAIRSALESAMVR